MDPNEPSRALELFSMYRRPVCSIERRNALATRALLNAAKLPCRRQDSTGLASQHFHVSLCPGLPGNEGYMKITIIYDNTSLRDDLKADWGFSALVEHQDKTNQFDTFTKRNL